MGVPAGRDVAHKLLSFYRRRAQRGRSSAKFQREMRKCEAAWREGEPLAVAEAVTLTYFYRQPPQAWLEQAVVNLAIGGRTKQQAKRHLADNIKFFRFQAVRDLHASGYSWEVAYEIAAERLAKTSMAGSAVTMKADYAKVMRDFKAKRFGKYFILRDKRFRHDGKPDTQAVPEPPFGPTRK